MVVRPYKYTMIDFKLSKEALEPHSEIFISNSVQKLSLKAFVQKIHRKMTKKLLKNNFL